MRKKSSSGSDKNPYQVSTKVHRFWEGNQMYSEASKNYFNERLNAFILVEANSKKINWQKR